MKMQPLAGVRVVDLTHILAGPFCTQLLADAGADVIKIEPPSGEYSRVRGPRRIGADGTEVSSYHAAVNHGKRCLALDLKNPDGLALAMKLFEDADVIVDNFAPGALRRLGIDLDELHRQRPELVSATISLYGPEGPLATRGGLAVVAEGESGILGRSVAGGSPNLLGFPLGDMGSGMVTFGAICAALFQRSTTGIGGHVDIAMVRTLIAFNAINVTGAQIPLETPFVTAAYGIFPTSDGFVTIGVNNDSLFQRFAVAIGRPELLEDERFASYEFRDSVANAELLNDILREWSTGRTTDEVMAAFAEYGVPAGRVTTPAQVLEDAAFQEMGYFYPVDDGIGGTVDTPANPFGFQTESARLPKLGEHRDEVLAELGLSTAEIEDLASRGAFGQSAAA